MKKKLALIVALLMIIAMITPAIAAAEAVGVTDTDMSSTTEDQTTGTPEASDPEEDDLDEYEFSDEELEKILTPDSPWYFVKRFIEKVRVLLTFNDEKKADLLAELAEERAKELAALEQKYADGELSDEELDTLEKALEDLVLYTEKYIEHLAEEPIEGQEPAEEEVTDKYQQRIAHLQKIAARAPDAAQKGLARAIACAQRQRARMIDKGKLSDELDLSILLLPFIKFELEIEADERELEVKFEHKSDGIKAEFEFEQEGSEDIDLKGSAALNYLLPILENLDLNATMSREQIIAKLLTAFNWDGDYEELEIKIKFADGSKIDIKSKATHTPTPLTLPYVKFELEIEADERELEVKFEQKDDGAKAEVEFEQKGSEDIELKGSTALNYLLPILENLDLNASMSRAQIIDKLLTAFNWDGEYEELEIKIEFANGAKIDFKSKGVISTPVTLPFIEFELEIERDDRELSVEFEQKRDGIEAEVEIEQKGQKDIELKGSAALNYLLPILEKLDLNASMSRQQITDRILTAFGWDGDYDDFEIKIKFADGTKIEFD